VHAGRFSEGTAFNQAHRPVPPLSSASPDSRGLSQGAPGASAASDL